MKRLTPVRILGELAFNTAYTEAATAVARVALDLHFRGRNCRNSTLLHCWHAPLDTLYSSSAHFASLGVHLPGSVRLISDKYWFGPHGGRFVHVPLLDMSPHVFIWLHHVRGKHHEKVTMVCHPRLAASGQRAASGQLGVWQVDGSLALLRLGREG